MAYGDHSAASQFAGPVTQLASTGRPDYGQNPGLPGTLAQFHRLGVPGAQGSDQLGFLLECENFGTENL